MTPTEALKWKRRKEDISTMNYSGCSFIVKLLLCCSLSDLLLHVS